MATPRMPKIKAGHVVNAFLLFIAKNNASHEMDKGIRYEITVIILIAVVPKFKLDIIRLATKASAGCRAMPRMPISNVEKSNFLCIMPQSAHIPVGVRVPPQFLHTTNTSLCNLRSFYHIA